MKKLFFLSLVLLLVVGQVVCFAGVQIDRGQSKSTAPVKFMVVRPVIDGFPNQASKDDIVVWDSNSRDGVTVKSSTTSGDLLVAGVMMDTVTWVSSDNTASQDESRDVWGRMQTWGYNDNVAVATGTYVASAGELLTHSSTAFKVGDTTAGHALSSDQAGVGVALQTCTDCGNIDMMIRLD